jgi:nicotinamidase-related amidase
MGPRLFTLLAAAGLAIGVAATPVAAQQVPAQPSPVPVTLDPATTALVVLDITTQTCTPQPNCMEMLPRVESLLSNARNAGVYVVYSVPNTQPPILPEVQPAQNDPVVIGQAQDRFFATPLDVMLRTHNVDKVLLVGWRENGSVLYTAVGGVIRGYTVAVADDGTSAATDYDIAIGRYQLLTQLNANATNDPLKKMAATLTRTDLITFQ